MADQPVAGGKHAARLQYAENFGEQRVLVRHVQERVLLEDHVEGCTGERKRTGRGPDETCTLRQTRLFSPPPRGFDDRLLDIEPRCMVRAVFFNQMQRDAA